jgi:hypothetical protein
MLPSCHTSPELAELQVIFHARACWLEDWQGVQGSACGLQGPGLQHLALKTNDVVATLRKMRRVSACGGFDFMPPLDKSYYQ